MGIYADNGESGEAARIGVDVTQALEGTFWEMHELVLTAEADVAMSVFVGGALQDAKKLG